MEDSFISTSAKIIPLRPSGATEDGKANGTRIQTGHKTQKTQEKKWSALAKEARTEASFKSPIKILEIPVLNEGECDSIKSIVMALEPYWIARGGNTFWTIGASTYNDELMPSENQAGYYQVAEENNFVISRAFGPLLDTVRDVISKVYQRECIDLPFAGLMGFHIFNDTAEERRDEGGNIHTDEPFQRLLWSEPFANPFSFTLAISLPEGEGGIDYWDEDNERHHLAYEEGTLYIHNGRFPHRIASPTWPTNDNPRITLQGHGALLLDTNRVAVYF